MTTEVAWDEPGTPRYDWYGAVDASEFAVIGVIDSFGRAIGDDLRVVRRDTSRELQVDL